MGLLALVMAIALRSHPSLAEPVWDGGQIARLAQNSAAANLILSELAGLAQYAATLGLVIGGSAQNGPPNWVASFLTPLTGLGLTKSGVPARVAAPGSLALDGLAMGLVSQNVSGNATIRSEDLLRLATNASDLRSDMRANSAAALATLGELIMIKSNIAVMLQQRCVQGAKSQRETP